ncbi:GNAT family N-acetyltransferase [Pseudoxanthomonas daejeonensis]|uniref:GNAT family N-acetyltransferase n=1 Tax=Pseudoxanthomonas daejeonensis TaxID=266062 RepID=UPI001F543E47|nr:GNAT family N-acetyltransferase [Pseudoxanthomonas daejeonensis]UNK58957.1 GNAT family N-acetyltransferase [Pseudoxanthomonas daejeonensis]
MKTAAPDIREATDEATLRAAWPVVAQLRPHLDEESFVAAAVRQQAEGWKATVLYDAGVPRAFAGWRVQEMLAHGRFLYIDDLVTDARTRSAGHGKALLDWLKEQARRLDCTSLQLDSGTQRIDAHAFYLRERLRITSFHFKADL